MFFSALRLRSRRQEIRPQFRSCLELLEGRVVPATLRVGSTEPYATIQAAVNAASPGDTIRVDPGTYTEQVTIGAGKDGLYLQSVNPQAAVIRAPASMISPKAIVEDNGAKNVTINGFTITGPGGGASDSIEDGIRVDSGGSAMITNNHITKIQDSPFSATQNGYGILIGHAAEGQTGSATITHNTIDNYQKGGIYVDNVGSSADIESNTITGVGPTSVIAQNGIQISRGASATISHNTISGNVYTPATYDATGILILDAGTVVTADHNTISNCDVSIWAEDVTQGTISYNQISGSTEGIVLYNASGVQILQNQVKTSGDDGIYLFSSSNNTLDHNQITGSQHDGIFVDANSTGNTITYNSASGSGHFDAEDDSSGSGTAGTGNFWSHNQIKTDNKGGGLGK